LLVLELKPPWEQLVQLSDQRLLLGLQWAYQLLWLLVA
jgi:hypothetical protein